jgi:hypothetical protein
VFIKASRGNFTNLPDTGIDDISAGISISAVLVAGTGLITAEDR